MLSIVWDGPQPVNQDWGCTTLAVEPFWQACISKHFHCGLDIGDPQCAGKPLYAARGGKVVALSPGILGIRADTDETDYYVHGTYLVALGQAVSRGQRIGSFGNVAPAGGVTFGPHLHFEVQTAGGTLNHPGTSVDPTPVLTATSGAATGAQGGDDDMWTDAEKALAFKKLNAILNQTGGGFAVVDATGANVDTPLWAEIKREFADIKDAIAKAAGPTVDVSGVNEKLDRLLAEAAALKTQTDAVKAKLDKDLA